MIVNLPGIYPLKSLSLSRLDLLPQAIFATLFRFTPPKPLPFHPDLPLQANSALSRFTPSS